MELLIVGAQHGLHRLFITAGSGENILAQFFQRNLGNASHALRHIPVPLSAGRRFEHNGIRHDGRRQQTRHLGGRHQTFFLVHGGDNGSRAAHSLVAHINGVVGLNIRQSVMVHDLQDLRLLQTQNRLSLLIVVHQNDTLTAGPQQMIAGQHTHHTLLLVQDGIGAETALQHGILHIVNVIIQMEANHISALTNTTDGQGVPDQAHSPVSVIRGGDNASVLHTCQQFRIHFCLTDNDAVHIQLQRTADHIRLIAADQNMFRIREHQRLSAGRQCQRHFAGNRFPQIITLVENLAFQNRQQIEYRHILQQRSAHRADVVVCHVTGRQRAVQGAVLIGHGDDRDLLGLHGLPATADGGLRKQRGGCIKIQVLDLCPYIGNELGGFKAKFIQHNLGLVTDLTQTGGLIFPVTQRVFQGGIRHGGNDRVRIRVSVSGDIDSIHGGLLSGIIEILSF